MTSEMGRAGGAGRWDTSEPIRYPDPDVRLLDPRFERLMLGHAAIERTSAAAGLPRGRCGSAICASWCSATFRTIG